jgi:predicted nuclease with TOPRIM domain
MNDFSKQAGELEDKLRQLTASYSELKRHHQRLEEENAGLKEQLRQQATEVKDLRKKAEKTENNFQDSQNFAKLVKSIQADTKDIAQLKGMIDEYLREIDKCIAFLMQ